jgi:hypothetical protein
MFRLSGNASNFSFFVVPPLSPPPLSTPAGAERGANSRIWPGALRSRVQGDWATRRWGCESGNGNHRARSLLDGLRWRTARHASRAWCASCHWGCAPVTGRRGRKTLLSALPNRTFTRPQTAQLAWAGYVLTKNTWPNTAVSSLFGPKGRERAGGVSGGKPAPQAKSSARGIRGAKQKHPSDQNLRPNQQQNTTQNHEY